MPEKITAAQYRSSKSGKGRVRGTRKTVVDGITFDSKREADRWRVLKAREAAGEISNLERQVAFPLFGKNDCIKTPTGRQMRYLADFTYVDWKLNGVKVVEDSKGWATDVYKIKKAILAAQGVEIIEV